MKNKNDPDISGIFFYFNPFVLELSLELTPFHSLDYLFEFNRRNILKSSIKNWVKKCGFFFGTFSTNFDDLAIFICSFSALINLIIL